MPPDIAFELDGRAVEVPDDGGSLLDALRERLGVRSVKDGCSPQGQCGCCTVLVDGSPRVACVTPTRRVAGRAVTTVDGLADRDRWVGAFTAAGASQCGFCTPGIIVRLSGMAPADEPAVERALAAHLCRCTGWRSIVDAWRGVGMAGSRDLDAACGRASLEGGCTQRVGPDVALGRAGFAADTAPPGSLVAVPGPGGWAVGETLAEARATAGKVQGRRTTVDPSPPLDLPPGRWDLTLRTSWVEPAYLETDASWCEPGGEPSSPLANGGAFGGKADSPAPPAARALADEHGRPVLVLLSREDTVRLGPKRPPIAAGVRGDGTGFVRVVRTPGIADAIWSVAPGFEVEEVDVAGPPTSAAVRAAGRAEASVLLAAARGDTRVGPASAEVSPDGASVRIRVEPGEVLDEVVLRSYCVGAAHMALGWVRSEGLAVDEAGVVHDLTVRSFGVLRASETPEVDVTVVPGEGPAVAVSDSVFAAVAAAEWVRQGCPPQWPTHPGGTR